ncbi:FecR family protein [Dyadobacter endophyticus]|uniref:FecR family protein n=1 Tax=Dyadobacter TaxID=120831 RepID=UPI003CE75AA5
MNKQDTRKLLQKYREGRCTPEERSWVEQWYLENARQQGTVQADLKNRHTATWKQIKRNIAGQKAAQRHWLRHPLVAAASVIFVLGLSFLIYRSNQARQERTASAVDYRAVATRNGELRKLSLPDGSQVWLNAASRLRYSSAFGDALREVYLDEGEAYFDVKHDPATPFIVYAGKTKTTVLGTAFAVKAYRSLPETKVIVMRGKVGVTASGNGPKDAVMLVKNQQASFDNTTFHRADVNAADFIGWTEGKLKFNNESLQAIALTLENRFDTTIRFHDRAIGDLRFSAGFGATEQLDDILEVLCLAENLTYTRSGKTITLAPR